MKRVLGLDLGTDSIGWAVLDVPEGDEEDGQIVALGTRIFSAGAEVRGSTVTTAAAERRQKRGMRRQTARRRRRKLLLRRELATVGLLPTEPAELERLFRLNPAELAKRGLQEKLEPHELGRVFLHMATHRGFLSLRKGGGAVGDEEESDDGFRHWRQRQDVEDRFDELWKAQAVHHADLLTDKLRHGHYGRQVYPVAPVARNGGADGASAIDEFGVHGLVFFQRKVFWRPGTIGRCLLTGEARCERADRLAQKFKILQTLVNIRVFDTPGGRFLSDEERQTLFPLLWKQKTVKFSRVRSALEIDEGVRINFEREADDTLEGNETDAALKQKRSIGPRYMELPDETRDKIVRILIEGGRDDLVHDALVDVGLTGEEADQALRTRLPRGRVRFSRAALELLIPELEKGYRLNAVEGEQSAISRAGFLQIHERGGEAIKGAVALKRVPEVTNPIVRATLIELRRVYNAIVREYGSPKVIRVEFARDVGANAKKRKETEQRQRQYRKAKDQARALIREHLGDEDPPRENVRKVVLWYQQSECCLYCGQPISVPALLDGSATQVDHILPRSRTLDDSQANVVVVCAKDNAEKGERTLCEWLGGSDPGRYNDILLRSREMMLPNAKRSRLEREHVDDEDEIPKALLVQTGYLTRLAREWLGDTLGIPTEVTRGRLTAELRRVLGLRKDPTDHRRHALDAVAVALTDIRSGQRLAELYKRKVDPTRNRPLGKALVFPEPWPGFRSEFGERYLEIVVSHRAKRKLSGALHEETFYGPTHEPGQYSIRRPISYFDKGKRLAEIADPAIREILTEAIKAKGFDPAGTFGSVLDPENPPEMPSGTKIRRVRTRVSLPGAREIARGRWVTLGNNHSASVFERSGGKLRIEITPMLAAASRVRAGESPVQRTGRPGERFLYSVCIGDSLLLDHPERTDRQGVFTVVKLDLANSRIWTLPNCASLPPESRNKAMVGFMARSLAEGRARKVVVTPTGKVRRASD